MSNRECRISKFGKGPTDGSRTYEGGSGPSLWDRKATELDSNGMGTMESHGCLPEIADEERNGRAPANEKRPRMGRGIAPADECRPQMRTSGRQCDRGGKIGGTSTQPTATDSRTPIEHLVEHSHRLPNRQPRTQPATDSRTPDRALDRALPSTPQPPATHPTATDSRTPMEHLLEHSHRLPNRPPRTQPPPTLERPSST